MRHVKRGFGYTTGYLLARLVWKAVFIIIAVVAVVMLSGCEPADCDPIKPSEFFATLENGSKAEVLAMFDRIDEDNRRGCSSFLTDIAQ